MCHSGLRQVVRQPCLEPLSLCMDDPGRTRSPDEASKSLRCLDLQPELTTRLS